MWQCGLILATVTLCAGTVSAQSVKVDWDRTTDFNQYKTYNWAKIPTSHTPTPAIEKLIHDEASVQIEAKGHKKLDSGEPDLYIGYSITLGKPKPGSAPPDPGSAPWQTGSSWSGKTSSEQAARKGTLSIEIADRKRNLLIWRGVIMAEIGDSVNDARAKISTGLSKAFAKFPPPAK